MRPSENCLNLVKHAEGFSSRPYLCPAGKPTIGYGATHYPDGHSVSLHDDPISETEASLMLSAMLDDYAAAIAGLIHVPLAQGQFDALVDFAYNCGVSNLAGSTLLKFVNAGNFALAAAEFGKWTHGGGKELPGLVARRAAERKLFEGA